MPEGSSRVLLTVGVNSTGYHADSWKHSNGATDRFLDPEFYRKIALEAHRGTLDALFLSDHPALMQDNATRPLHSLDPLVLFSALAGSVPDLGFMLTASTSFNSPYNLARRLATLDIVSGGRTIWNVVSSFNPAVAANFADDPLPPRAERYDKAAEFLDVAFALWSSWSPRRPDRSVRHDLWGEFAPIDHHGRYFDIAGPLNVPGGPQGRPVIAQAGASEPGLEFAARYAEIVYTAQLGKDSALAFTTAARRRAREAGRPAGSVRVLPGLVPFIGSTRNEAQRRYEQIVGEDHSEERLLRDLAFRIGIDPADLDPDRPVDPELLIPRADQNAPHGFTAAVRSLAQHETLTARQLALRVEGGHHQVIGTPRDVADQILEWWRSGAADGFNVLPPVLPEDLSVFVDEVIPLLRAEGAFPSEYREQTVRERFELPWPEQATSADPATP